MDPSEESPRPNGKVEEQASTPINAIDDPTQIEGSSDGEGERAARERLKKTSIAGLAQKSSDLASPGEQHPLAQSVTRDSEPPAEGMAEARGRPAKKRSFEDLTRDDSAMAEAAEVSEQPLPKSGHHKRMRSRDLASGEHVVGKFEADSANSVREESDLEAQTSPGGPGVIINAPLSEEARTHQGQPSVRADQSTAEVSTASLDTEATSKSKLTEDGAKSPAKAVSGFANTSTVSPFGSLSASKSPSSTADTGIESKDSTTSSSAFASSGLSAFASSEKSPFSAAGTKSVGGFGGGGSSTASFGAKPHSGFGNISAASPFAPKPSSGFGAGGGGFGSASGFGSSSSSVFGAPKPFAGGLSSFAGPSGGVGTFGTGKPFGASKDDEDDGSDNEDDEEDERQNKDVEQDDRFHEQDVETGEEEEDTIFVCRAKLYHFEKEWKERGVGSFKINVRYVEAALRSNSKSADEQTSAGEDEEGQRSTKDVATKDFSGDDVEAGTDESFVTTERRARLLMRTDGVHKVILNTPVFKDMHIGERDGSEPSGKTMHLTGLEEGKLKSFQIKIGKEELLKDLYWKVVDLRTDLA